MHPLRIQQTNSFNRFDKMKVKQVFLYGDPAGKAGEKHAQKSNYDVIENVLKMNGWQVKRRVSNAAPRIIDRQNTLRKYICNAMEERTLFVNPDKCPTLYKGLISTVVLKAGSSFLEDDSIREQHISTAVGYMFSNLDKSKSVTAPANIQVNEINLTEYPQADSQRPKFYAPSYTHL